VHTIYYALPVAIHYHSSLEDTLQLGRRSIGAAIGCYITVSDNPIVINDTAGRASTERAP